MSGFVLDSSVTMAWCFDEETTDYTEAVLDRLARGEEAIVPSLWPYEVSNVLLGALRKKRVPQAKAARFLAEIRAFAISVDESDEERVFRDVVPLAHQNQLTAYDAAYLELAMRKSLPLATLDLDLRKAAKQMGIPILGPGRHS